MSPSSRVASGATALAPFSIERLLVTESSQTLRALAALPPSHVLASSTDGSLRLYGPDEGALRQEVHYDPPPTKKAIDRIVVLESVGKVILLSEGVLSFHRFPDMEIMPAGAAGGAVNISNLIKGVSAFAVDDPSANTVRLALAKRKSLNVYNVTSTGVDALKEIPLSQPVYLAAFRKNALCVADRESYSVFNLKSGDAAPLLPISQDAPHSDEAAAPALAAPSIAAVGQTEFLIASHTGAGSLGLFVRHNGDPCRGTITWPSRVRSLVVEGPPAADSGNVDQGYVLALLRNNTIEVHHLGDLTRTAQVIAIDPESIKDPRLLVPLSDRGLDFTGNSQSQAGSTLSHVKVPLFSAPEEIAGKAASVPRPHRQSSLRTRKHLAPAKSVLLCRHSVYAIQPLTLLVQAEALFAQARAADAVLLADASRISETTRYINLKAALVYLGEGNFQEAGDCFIKSIQRKGSESQRSLVVDPRLVLRMWPDMRSGLVDQNSDGEVVEIWKGAEEAVRESDKTIESLIIADLYRNYSPHVQPDIEHASSTTELRRQLTVTAREMTMRIMQAWRAQREQGSSGSRALDKVVDTALAKLLAEEGDDDGMLALVLVEPSNVKIDELIQWLDEASLDRALARLHIAQGRIVEALPICTRLYDTTVPPDTPPMTLSDIESLVEGAAEERFKKEYGMWFLSRHRSTGLKILSSLTLESADSIREMMSAVQEVDIAAGEELIELLILQHRVTDTNLQTEVVLRLIGLLLNASPDAKRKLAEQESAFKVTSGREPKLRGSFLDYLLGLEGDAELIARRLKLIVFLRIADNSDNQRIRQSLEQSACLAYERCIAYGRLKLHRIALATLAITLGDMVSAEAYCSNKGAPLSLLQLGRIAIRVDLPLAAPKPSRRRLVRTTLDAERVELVQTLVDLCLQHHGTDTGVSQHATVDLISKQAMHLNLGDILSRTPADWTVQDLEPFCVRALRRSLDERQELLIVKAVAAGYNLTISDEVYGLQEAAGSTLVDDADIQRNQATLPAMLADKVVSAAVDDLEKSKGPL